MDIPTIIVILGAALLFVAISGGGIAFKEVSMPRISNMLRIILAPIGLVFIIFGIVLWVNPSVLTGVPPLEGEVPSETPPFQSAPANTVPDVAPSPTSVPDVVVQSPTPVPSVATCDEFDTRAGGWPSFSDPEEGEVGYSGGQFRIAFYSPGHGFDAAWSPDQYSDFSNEDYITFQIEQ